MNIREHPTIQISLFSPIFLSCSFPRTLPLGLPRPFPPENSHPFPPHSHLSPKFFRSKCPTTPMIEKSEASWNSSSPLEQMPIQFLAFLSFLSIIVVPRITRQIFSLLLSIFLMRKQGIKWVAQHPHESYSSHLVSKKTCFRSQLPCQMKITAWKLIYKTT